LIPYYYTLFFEAHIMGGTVARPLFYEFYTDNRTYGIDSQFMIGSGLLATPVLDQGGTTVNAFFPIADWFGLYTGAQVVSLATAAAAATTDGTFLLDAPLSRIPLYFRGGTIIPRQQPALTTTAQRNNPYFLYVVLSSNSSLGTIASGSLYVDD